MERDEVLIRLIDHSEKVTDEFAGHLEVETDETGVIKWINISNTDDDLAPYFERHASYPAIPGTARFEADNFGAADYGMPSDFEWSDHNRHIAKSRLTKRQRTARKSNEADYQYLHRGAHRLLERVLRGEPVLIGHKDVEQHLNFFRRGDDEFKSDALSKLEHARRGPPHQRSRATAPNIRKFVRVRMKPIKESKSRPLLVCNIPLDASGYPARLGRIYGDAIFPGDNSEFPLSILEDGSVALHTPSHRHRLHRTNLFGRTITPGTQVAFWEPRLRQHAAYVIANVEALFEGGKSI